MFPASRWARTSPPTARRSPKRTCSAAPLPTSSASVSFAMCSIPTSRSTGLRRGRSVSTTTALWRRSIRTAVPDRQRIRERRRPHHRSARHRRRTPSRCTIRCRTSRARTASSSAASFGAPDQHVGGHRVQRLLRVRAISRQRLVCQFPAGLSGGLLPGRRRHEPRPAQHRFRRFMARTNGASRRGSRSTTACAGK